VDQQVTRQILSNIPPSFVGRESCGWMHYAINVGFPVLFIGKTIIFFNHESLRRPVFSLSLALVGIIEVR
jgi:hypothetical protein